MRILISNDDGYFAPGIEHLAAALAKHADITVVAPERDRSGASNSLTLDRPLLVRRAPNGFLFVNGTPTDCVHLAVTGLLDDLPDMVVSGINRRRQHGRRHDLFGHRSRGDRGLPARHSVGRDLAGVEGCRAFRNGRAGRGRAGRTARPRARGRMAAERQRPGHRARPRCKAWRSRGSGRRHKAEDVIRTQNPRGETVYWVGAAGAAADAGEGTDFHAVATNRVSVTPLQIDLTNRELMAGWTSG